MAVMGLREVIDEVGPGSLEHEDLARCVGRAMGPHDADHLRLALVMPHVIEQRRLAR